MINKEIANVYLVDKIKNKNEYEAVIEINFDFDSLKSVMINTLNGSEDISKHFKDLNIIKNHMDLVRYIDISCYKALDFGYKSVLIPIPFSIWIDYKRLIDTLFTPGFFPDERQNISVYILMPYKLKIIDYDKDHSNLFNFVDKTNFLNLNFLKKSLNFRQVVDRIFKKYNTDYSGIISSYTYSKMKNPNYIPSKETVISIAVGCGLSKGETQELLKKAGYWLSELLEYDQIIIDGIENNKDIDEINDRLLDVVECDKKTEDYVKCFLYRKSLLGPGELKKMMIEDKAKKLELI